MKVVLDLLFIPADEEWASHIAVQVKVNGKKATMIIDTGASNTVFDLNKIDEFDLKNASVPFGEKAIGLGSDQLETQMTSNVSLKIDEMEFTNFSFVLLDLSIINETFKRLGAKEIEGIIGTDLLLSCKALINYRKKTLSLSCTKKVLNQRFRLDFMSNRIS